MTDPTPNDVTPNDQSRPDQSRPGSRRQRRAWYLYGWASQPFPTVVVTVFMSRYLTAVAENAVGKNGRIHVLGIPIAPGSLFAYTVSAATILLVVLMPIVGALADRTGRKRDIMLGCGAVGALACVAMVFVAGSNWQLGTALFAVAFLGYSTSIVVSYSLLVDLSAHDERDAVSSTGWAIAYLGGGIPLAIDFALSLALDKSTLARVSLCFAGVWWLAFGAVVRRGLPRRIGAAAADEVRGSALAAGFRHFARTVRQVRALPLTLAFLAAFLIYNDGIQTVTVVAAQYGDKELRLSDTVLLLGILIVQFVAYAGAVGLGRLAAVFGARRVVMGSLVVWLLAVLIAYRLQAGVAWQFHALAVLIALVLGGSQALSRAIFSRLIPPGAEAQYFAFYEISDAGTSWLGPLVFGLTYQNTGSYRSALISLVAFFVIGFLALWRVPLRRAIVAAGNVAPQKV